MLSDDLITAFLEEKSSFSSPTGSNPTIEGENILVDVNYGDFQRSNNYSIPILDLFQFIWERIPNKNETESRGDGLY